MTAVRWWVSALLATVLASAVSFQWLDRPIAFLVHRQGERPQVLGWLTLTPDPLIPLALVSFIALSLWTLSGRILVKWQWVLLICSISVIVAEAVKTQLKFIFGRTWPDTWIDNNPSLIRDGVYGFNPFHGGGGYASFPSGHMTALCAVLVVLWMGYPKLRAIYLLLAVIVAAALVGEDYHFLSDVIAGVFVGASIGWMSYTFAIDALIAKHETTLGPRNLDR